MRLHIALDDDLVAEVDRRAGPRRRSAFIAELIQRGLDNERRWDDIEAALGGLPDLDLGRSSAPLGPLENKAAIGR